jgi:hypothetical protein
MTDAEEEIISPVPSARRDSPLQCPADGFFIVSCHHE